MCLHPEQTLEEDEEATGFAAAATLWLEDALEMFASGREGDETTGAATGIKVDGFATLVPHCRQNLVVGLSCALHLTQAKAERGEDALSGAANEGHRKEARLAC